MPNIPSRERLTELMRQAAETRFNNTPSRPETIKMLASRFGLNGNLPQFSGPPARPSVEEVRKMFEDRNNRIKGFINPDENADVDTQSTRLNIASQGPGRIVPPITPVPTSSPAYKKGGAVKGYAKGGLVRGCGKATKGHGKVRMY